METRICRICTLEKPLTEFYPRPGTKAGYRSECKDCFSQRTTENGRIRRLKYPERAALKAQQDREKRPHYYQEWYQKNREAQLAKQKAFREANPEVMKARKAASYQRNKETIQAKALLKRDETLAKKAAYRARNREATNKKARDYAQKYPEKIQANSRATHQRNPGAQLARNALRRARKRNAPFIEKVDKYLVFERDRWICQICFSKVDPNGKGRERPTRDHVIPLAEGGEESYRNSVLAHLKCNSRKGNRHNIPQQQRLFG